MRVKEDISVHTGKGVRTDSFRSEDRACGSLGRDPEWGYCGCREAVVDVTHCSGLWRETQVIRNRCDRHRGIQETHFTTLVT